MSRPFRGTGPFALLRCQSEQLHEAGCNGPRITGTDPMILHQTYIGCDISKHHLDIFDPRTGHVRVANTDDAITQWLGQLDPACTLAVFEATGRYDQTLRRHLISHAIGYARLNPVRTRRFAEATGQLAKTDRLDAAMLADLGKRLQPPVSAPDDPERVRLGDLVRRRGQLVDMRAAEKVRRNEAGAWGEDIAACLNAHIAWLDAAIAALDKAIASLVASRPALKAAAGLMRTAPGIGQVTATTLMALMPELGRRAPGQIAALAGLAPLNADSGSLRGVRRIQGGRRQVRKALYMAAVTAARSNTRFKAFYQRLINAGKAAKTALIAVARKLLITLNAMLRDQKQYTP